MKGNIHGPPEKRLVFGNGEIKGKLSHKRFIIWAAKMPPINMLFMRWYLHEG